MVPSAVSRLDAFVLRHVEAGDWPGGAYAVGPAGSRPLVSGACGLLASSPEREPAREDALYDLASLTKALVLTPIVLRLAARGTVDLDRPLDDLLPELGGGGVTAPSMRDLMLHRSGLPAWRGVYRECEAPGEVVAAIGRMPRDASGHSAPVYSCLGSILAGIAIERSAGSPLSELLRSELCSPLGIRESDLFFGPVPEQELTRTAPTESGRRYEEMLAAGGALGREIVPGPDRVLRGEVHDGNARFLGGQAGNAGAFGTCAAVFRVASAMTLPDGLLDDDSRRLCREPVGGGAERRTFGFQHGESRGAPAGALGRGSFGHTGFTGTSVWIDPGRRVVAVLLTNRVHPRYREAPMQRWRQEFHDLAARVIASGAC
jgi:CubicO group peptidase (beta-lactamase class C family)